MCGMIIELQQMKKLFYITTMFFSSLTYSFSQLPTAQEEKNKYKWSISTGINNIDFMPGYTGYLQYTSDGGDGSLQGSGERKNKSLSISFLPKYYLTNDLLLRFEFGISNILMTRFVETKKVTHETYSAEVKQTNYRYVLGIEYLFIEKKRVELSGGMIIPYVNYGNIVFIDSSFSRDTTINNSILSWWTGKANIPGGFSIGVGPILKINYKFLKHVSIGAESSYSFYYTKVGGMNNSGSTYYPTPSSQPIITSNSYKDTFQGFHFSKIHSSINISIIF